MKEWTSPNQGSPDVFVTSALGKFRFKRPMVRPELHAPRSGYVMVGIKTYGCASRTLHCKEYLQIQLKEPLEKNKEYYVEFWVNPLSTGIKTSHFGVSLSDVAIKEPMEIGLFYFDPVVLDTQVIDSPPKEWKRIAGTFTADYSYGYLIIGNFFSDEETNVKTEDPGIKYSYYFIDDVLLKPLHEDPPLSLSEAELKVGVTLSLRNIHFAFDKADLLPQSFTQLDELVAILKAKPTMVIRINGHTDNIGKTTYNLSLSQDRAQAVKAYLTDNGIPAERLSAQGYGASLPLADNRTEEGRQLNRRVEITVVGE